MDRISGAGCVVTGVAGFVGSHLAERLLSLGSFVVGIDNFFSGCLENMSGFINHPRFVFLERNIEENNLLDDLKKKYPELRYLFQLAAIVSVPYSIDHPDKTMEINWRATMRLLNSAERLGFDRFVFAGSAAEYAESERLPILEEHAEENTVQLSPYGRAKFLSSRDVATSRLGVSLRCFNIYGPRQDPSSSYSGVISRFIEMGCSKKPLTVFGNGKQTRDFVYVQDVVEAYVSAAGVTSNANGISKKIFNVGTGEKISIKQLADIVRELTDNVEPLTFLPERQGDIQHSVASIDALREAANWNPRISLRDGLMQTVHWYLSQEHKDISKCMNSLKIGS